MANRYIELDKKNQVQDQKKSNAVKHFNLGFFVYLFILLYLIFCIISFTTNKKINYTSAEISSIIETSTYQGIILRNESVYTANKTGTTTFFYPDGAKVQEGSLLVTIDDEGAITDALKESISESEERVAEQMELSDEDYTNLSNKLRTYMVNKDVQPYISTYYVKYEVEKALNDISNTLMLADKENYETLLESQAAFNEKMLENSTVYTAKKSGILSYHIDGYEQLTIDNYSISDLLSRQEMDTIYTMSQTTEGQALLKLVDNYEWYIVSKVDGEFKRYAEENGGEIQLLVNGNTNLNGSIEEIYYSENELYAEIKIIGAMEHFLESRFVDYTIVYNEINGIKLPNSSVVSKEFLVVPYGVIQMDGSKIYIKRKVYSDEAVNAETLEELSLDYVVYEDEFAYIPADVGLEYGDTVYVFESGVAMEEVTVKHTVTYEGVYIINQGFVEFKPIRTLYSTEDYRIIEENMDYSIMMSDRVVVDCNQVVENDYIY